MYDYDQLVDAAYAFLNLGLISLSDYGHIVDELDHMISANDERIRFE